MVGNHDETQKAYRDLISDFADMQPLHGFHDVTDVPELSVEDCDLIVRAQPDSLNDVEELGLLGSLRKWLLSELQEECERRDLERQQTDSPAPGTMTYREERMSYFGVKRLLS